MDNYHHYIFRVSQPETSKASTYYQQPATDGNYQLSAQYGPYQFNDANNQSQSQYSPYNQSMYAYPTNQTDNQDKKPSEININLYLKLPKHAFNSSRSSLRIPLRIPLQQNTHPSIQANIQAPQMRVPYQYPKPSTYIPWKPLDKFLNKLRLPSFSFQKPSHLSSQRALPSRMPRGTPFNPYSAQNQGHAFKPTKAIKQQRHASNNNYDLISKVPNNTSVSSPEYKQFLENLDNYIENDRFDALMDFANRVPQNLEKSVGENSCKHVVEKTVGLLRTLDDNEYNTNKAIDMLNLMSRYTLTIRDNYYNDDIKKWAYDFNLNTVLKKNINHYLHVTDSEFNGRKKGIASIYSTLSNITFDDEQILENKRSGFIEKALSILDSEVFFNEKNVSESDEIVLYDEIIEFLWQIVKVSDFNKFELVDSNLAEKLIYEKKKIKTALDSFAKDNETFEVFENLIVIILAQILNDEQLKNSELSNNVVLTLFKLIHKIIAQSAENEAKNDTKYYTIVNVENIENKKKEITLENCLKCLLRISTNDEIKSEIYKLKGLESLIKIMQEDENAKEQVLCAQVVSNLCLNNEVKEEIKKDEGVMKLIEDKTNNSESKEVARSYETLVNSVDDKLEKRLESIKTDETKKSNEGQHIMLSYCHSDKKICWNLNKILKNHNFKVWIDEENMNDYGNVFDGMASAVEDSILILMCYSEAYKMSPNCQREAQYATKLKKTIIPLRVQPKYSPDGWLGLLINQDLYFDVSNPNLKEADPVIDKVLDRIKSVLNLKLNDHDDDTSKTKAVGTSGKSSDSKDSSSKETSVKESSKKEKIENWTNEDIVVWLYQHKLSDWCQPLKDFNGSALLGLHYTYKNNFTNFLDIIDNLLKDNQMMLAWSDKMKLVDGLQNLL